MAHDKHEAAARREPTPSSNPPSIHRPNSTTQPTGTTATHQTSLAKRILFPHLLPDEPVPPLFTSPSVSSVFDDEIYDFIALALRAFINPWWTKLSRYDKDFLPHITSILAHVLRTLEERVHAVDLSPLIFRDAPLLLNQHYADYRAAAAKCGSAYAAGGAAGIGALFHAQQQHTGITPEGTLDDVYVRTAIDGVLRICLPTEDWESESERHIVREVIVMVICKAVVPKVTQGWFVQKLMLDLMGHEDISLPPETTPTASSQSHSSVSAHAVIILLLSTLKTISSIGLTLVNAYKQVKQMIRLVNGSVNGIAKTTPIDESIRTERTSGDGTTPRPPISLSKTPSLSSSFSATSPEVPAVSSQLPGKDLAFPSLFFLSSLFSLSARLASSAVFILATMLMTFFSPFLDKLLPYLLYKYILTPPRLVGVIVNAKRSLFPNGYPAQAPPDPTIEEQLVIRNTLAACIDARIPGWISLVLLGSPAVRRQTVDEILDPISDAACNTHLFLYMLDAVLLALFPEMGLGADEHEGLGQGHNRS